MSTNPLPKIPTKAALLALAEDFGLSDRLLACLDEYAQPSIRFLVGEMGENIPVGTSKIGGNPDLPPEISYPFSVIETKTLEPRGLLTQINLAEIALYNVQGYLPQQGMLYFFFTDLCFTDNNHHIQLYEGDLSNLQRTPFPRNYPMIDDHYGCQWYYEERRLRFQVEWQAPNHWVFDRWLHISFDESELERYDDFLQQHWDMVFYPHGGNHHLLGTVTGGHDRNNMQLEIIFDQQGWHWQNPYDRFSKLTAAEQANYYQRANEWLLLLQIDSDHDLQFQWNDFGSLYFWIHQDDLKQKRFDKIKFTHAGG